MKNKIWFVCEECCKYHWIEATPETLDWYDGLGDDCSYCPYCDDEQPTRYEVGKYPVPPMLRPDAFR